MIYNIICDKGRTAMILAELLKIPCFSKSRIVAGEKGMNQRVHSVNMMDAPDIIDFLKPQELLLTTAYAIKDHPEALETLVSKMAKVGCAGLAIKTKRFLTEIPYQVVNVANKLNFPIIELPLDVTLGEALNQSLSYILEKRTDELRYALDSHRHFTNMILEGKSIPEIVQELSILLGSPVLLLNHKLDLISSSHHFQNYRNKVLPVIQDALKPLPPARFKQSFCLAVKTEFPFQNAVIHPIQTYQSQGFLISFIEEQQDNNLPFLAMEQAANVISFEMLKQQAVKERSRRYKNEFFSDLVEGFVTSEQEVIHRGKRYGLSERSTSLCIVAKQDPPTEKTGINSVSLEDSRFSEREDLYQLLKKEFTDNGLPFVIFTKNDLFVLILASNSNESSLPAMEKGLAELLKKIVDKIYKQTQISVSFGVGNPVENILDISVTYKEALNALQTGYSSKKRKFVQFYHVKELTDLLRMVPMEELKKFYSDTFKDLEGLEEKERKELMKTLMIFYENHCQIAETAKQLFVHRNTVIYRLDKCQQLTGRNLRSPSDSLRFRVANLIEPLLK
jgi:purine catabolism regulator